ncbi:MAG TPA: 50S ribosomal protein L11 methyltransferase, partial [Candidatus Limnocylindrales bacterium]
MPSASRHNGPPPVSLRRALITRHTNLQPVDGLPGVRLHLAHDAAAVWSATQDDDGWDAAPIPFWAFAWSGGLALARYLADHPDAVAGERVLDFGTGSGLVAIVAARLGAASVVAADVDPFAETATELNAKANRVRL